MHPPDDPGKRRPDRQTLLRHPAKIRQAPFGNPHHPALARANDPLRPSPGARETIETGTLMPMTPATHLRPAIRIPRDKANHHLWNNNGTWWCHFTLRSENGSTKRHRISLRTVDLEKARVSRDRILNDLMRHAGRLAA
jgi:hypothetical protein